MTAALCAFFAAGCVEKYTYPANTVPTSIERICRDEYQIHVFSRVSGKTVGALFYTNSIDEKGQLTKTDRDRMNKVLQSITRVSLSTDLPLEYCVVVIRDRIHNTEFRITQSIDDIKRAYAEALGVEEYMNRMTVGQQRFQNDPANENKFVLDDVHQEDFLAQQISQRIRYFFYKDIQSEANLPLVLVDGAFGKWDGRRAFRFSIMASKNGSPAEMILDIFKVVNKVLVGYKYNAFDDLEILDYMNRQKLVLPKQVLLQYQNKKISDQEILDKYLMEAQSIQDAFKLFGFNIPQDTPPGEVKIQATAAK